MEYLVYEVQLEMVVRKCLYRVEAESPEAALEVAQHPDDDEHAPMPYGTLGDSDFSDSGWAVRPNTECVEHDAWEEAAKNLRENYQ